MNELRAAAGKNAFPVALCGIESGGAGLWHSAFGPDNRRGECGECAAGIAADTANQRRADKSAGAGVSGRVDPAK